jgi:hypothetical protein
VAGAPFFFGDSEALGVALVSGVTVGLTETEGDSSGDGLGVGELFRFFFLLDALGEDSGDGLGEDFFFFTDADALGEAVSAAVGLAEDFFLVGGDFSGVVVGFGVGDLSAVDFFFVCLRGAGVGVGSKIFLSFVPKDSSAGARTANAARIARQTSIVIPSAVEGSRRKSRDVPRGPSTALRFARDDTRVLAENYFFASSARTALFNRMPPSRFSSGKFSFGE